MTVVYGRGMLSLVVSTVVMAMFACLCSFDAASAVQLVSGDVTDKCAFVVATGVRWRLSSTLRRLV